MSAAPTPSWWSSLRARITVIASGITLVILVLVSMGMLFAQQRQLDNAVDAALEESIVDVQTELRITIDRRRTNRAVNLDVFRVLASNSNRDLQLIRSDGVVEVGTGELADQRPIVDPSSSLATGGGFETVTAPDGERFRVVTTQIGTERVLVVGYSMADVDAAQRALRRNLLVTLPVLAALLGVLIWQVVGRALEPVESMRGEVDAISTSDLSRRVTRPDTTELSRLAETMNSMLHRIQSSVEQQQRFVADASHELRSPLAGIRGQLEVNIAHPEAAGREEAESDMLAETIRMQALVEDLLALARADRGHRILQRRPVDLDDLVLEEAASLARRTACVIDTSAVSAAQVGGDAEQLRRVVRNLLTNAVRHARSAVLVSLSETAEGAELIVVDDGPGVPAELSERIFERFTRSDDARARETGGSGLGLAISRAIVEAHGGTIALEQSDGGARFAVRLPRAV